MGFIRLIQENISSLADGLWGTVWMTVLSLIFAMIIGLVFGMMNVTKSKVLHIAANFYIDLVRGVPLIVLAYFICFAFPIAVQNTIDPDFRMNRYVAGIAALSMNAGAYMSEIIRAGIQSIDKGQMEASRSLGLTYGKSMRKVILPQAFRVMVPSIINQFVITLKDTSLLSIIGPIELTKATQNIIGRNFRTLEMWTISACLYLIVITTLTKISRRIEKRIAYDKQN